MELVLHPGFQVDGILAPKYSVKTKERRRGGKGTFHVSSE
jgi:hypothetical protein